MQRKITRRNLKVLKKVLRDNDALTKFKLNLRKDGMQYSMNRKDVMQYSMNSIKYTLTPISGAFAWYYTNEGHEYWARLNRIYMDLENGA